MFLVHTYFDPPEALQHREVVGLRDAERDRAGQLQQDGILLHLWRESHTTKAWGVWNVDSLDELTAVMSTLPLYRYMSVSATPIETHPNATNQTLTPTEGER